MILQKYIWKELSDEKKEALLDRSETDIRNAMEKVAPIIEDVRTRGDAALKEYSLKFDGADLAGMPVRVSDAEFDHAEASLDGKVKEALEYAIENVRRFHMSQKPKGIEMVEIRPGILAGEASRPIESAGLYVPRGRGSFPSMLYMLAVPAVIAGVDHIAIVTPPGPDGTVDPACLYAARLCGVSNVYRGGGAQAIAALAYGTESIPPCQKVVGPGSMYVTAAKRLLAQIIDPGLPAGPSESIVVADETADPELVCADLFIEAEHGSDSSALLITDSSRLAEEVSVYAEEYLLRIPGERRGYIRDVFSGYGGIILVDDMQQAIEVVNLFAPEHLQLQTASPLDLVAKIRNAGEILLGSKVPFSVANYAVGANAVLPTGGKAKTWSAVSVRDFIHYSSVVQVGDGAYKELAEHTTALADYEGFFTHAEALRIRQKRSNG